MIDWLASLVISFAVSMSLVGCNQRKAEVTCIVANTLVSNPPDLGVKRRVIDKGDQSYNSIPPWSYLVQLKYTKVQQSGYWENFTSLLSPFFARQNYTSIIITHKTVCNFEHTSGNTKKVCKIITVTLIKTFLLASGLSLHEWL